MLQQRQRARSHRQQRLILALGCGSSVVLHLGLIVGISYWWRSPAPVDEPIDITLVEPTEIEPVAVVSPPPLAKPPRISVTPIPSQVSQLKPVSKPAVVMSMPKPVAIAIKPISEKLQTAAKPTPKSSPIQPKVKPNPSPIQTSKVNLPVNPKPAPKPTQSAPTIKTTPKPIFEPPFTFPTPQPPKTSAVSTPIQSSLVANSPLVPVEPKSLGAAIPTSQPANTITSNLISPISPKSQDRSTTRKQPPGDGSIPDNLDESVPNRDRATGDVLTGNGDRFNPPTGSNLPSPNRSTPGSGNDDSAEPMLGDRMGNSSPIATSQLTAGGLQCIQHCEIPHLRDLQDRDGGKDRLRIRIVIDPNGLVLAATIAKSSDNPQIDALVLEGIKQMQFKPSGQIIKGIIKANILL